MNIFIVNEVVVVFSLLVKITPKTNINGQCRLSARSVTSCWRAGVSRRRRRWCRLFRPCRLPRPRKQGCRFVPEKHFGKQTKPQMVFLAGSKYWWFPGVWRFWFRAKSITLGNFWKCRLVLRLLFFESFGGPHGVFQKANGCLLKIGTKGPFQSETKAYKSEVKGCEESHAQKIGDLGSYFVLQPLRHHLNHLNERGEGDITGKHSMWNSVYLILSAFIAVAQLDMDLRF